MIGGGCHDCHTTKKMGPKGPEPDMSRMLSGHPESIKVTAPYKPAHGSQWALGITDTLTAWSGPWGVSFAANLTPDPTTGITSGELLKGVRYEDVYAYTQSMVLRSASGTMRIVDAYHPIDKLRAKGMLPEQVAVR